MDETIEEFEFYIEFYHNMPNSKRKAKRDRQQLGSSDMEEDQLTVDLHDIRLSIITMKEQLQKLDLLKKLTDDVEELKQSLEFNNFLIEVLKADNASLRVEVNSLKRLTTELQIGKVTMANDMLDLQCRSMRDNIIFHGLPEERKETYQTTERLVKLFMKEKESENGGA